MGKQKPWRNLAPLGRDEIASLVDGHQPIQVAFRSLWVTQRELLIDAIHVAEPVSESVVKAMQVAVLSHLLIASGEFGDGEMLWCPAAVDLTRQELFADQVETTAKTRTRHIERAAQGMAPHLWRHKPKRSRSSDPPPPDIYTEPEMAAFEKHRWLIQSELVFRRTNFVYSVIAGAGQVDGFDTRCGDDFEFDNDGILWMRARHPDRRIAVAADQAPHLAKWVGTGPEPVLELGHERYSMSDGFKQLGVDWPNPRTLRNTWAVRRLRAGAPPAAIQEAVGNRFSNLYQLLVYVDVADCDRAALAANPSGVTVRRRSQRHNP